MAELSKQLEEQYKLRFAEKKDYRHRVWQALCYGFFQNYIEPQFTVLDLGAGWGEFITNIRCAKKYAMDLNPETARNVPGDVKCLHQDCSEPWQMADGVLDAVFTSNFLEHLPDKQKIERTVAEAYRCLKPNGLMICLGPNVKYVPGAYWDFWDHYVPITENSLAELLRMNGFEVETCWPRFLPYTMSGGTEPPLFFVKLYLKLPLFWRFFGKQFLVIARKSAS
ncbi:MAG: class I SAM-dependent methyltransferase [Acidobacteriota bacterium]|nr:class I SAM-dependent methyltransferase [Acidobacteriota bacterium]